MPRLATGKLPPALLRELLEGLPPPGPGVVLGGRYGEDAAALECGDRLLLAKTDPVTFATDRPGWYAVQVNANDIAAMGGECRWFLATLLLPEGQADEALARALFADISRACAELGVALVGGHTEITAGLRQAIVVGTMLGEAERGHFCDKRMARAGDCLLLTKALAVEGTTLLARDFSGRLTGRVRPETLTRAREFLFVPGISVVREARLALDTGFVHAMHDPTEGGLATALAELAEAAGLGAALELPAVPVFPETRECCAALGLDPLGLISSGSLLIAAAPEGETPILDRLAAAGLPCARIGRLLPAEEGLREVDEQGQMHPLRRFARDELTRLF